MLREAFTERLKAAMRAQDARTLSAVRLILAGLKDRDIAARGAGNAGGIAESEILRLLQGMVKQRREFDRAVPAGQPPRLAQREEEEIAVIESFLPQQMSDAEIAAAAEAAIAETGAAGIKDMGRVMTALARAPCRRHRHGPRRRRREAAAGMMACVHDAGIAASSRLAGGSGEGARGRIAADTLTLPREGPSPLLAMRRGADAWPFRPAFSTNCAAGSRSPSWSGGGCGWSARAANTAAFARSITKRRRPSTSSRTRGSFIASAAARMATRSAFVMRADNLDFIEAVERLAGEAGLAVPQQTP